MINEFEMVSLFYGYFMDFEVLDLDVFPHIFRDDFNDSFFVGTQSDVGVAIHDFLTPQFDVLAFGVVSLEMVSIAGHVVELNQSGFLFVEGVHLQVVFMQDDVICSVVFEDARVDFFQEVVAALIKSEVPRGS